MESMVYFQNNLKRKTQIWLCRKSTRHARIFHLLIRTVQLPGAEVDNRSEVCYLLDK